MKDQGAIVTLMANWTEKQSRIGEKTLTAEAIHFIGYCFFVLFYLLLVTDSLGADLLTHLLQ